MSSLSWVSLAPDLSHRGAEAQAPMASAVMQAEIFFMRG
jgi:hypothetical protein